MSDDFTRGYLLAVANIMHTHGEDVIAGDVLSQIGESEGVLRRLGLDDFDAKPLRKLFRQNKRLAKIWEERRLKRSITPRRASDLSANDQQGRA